MTEQLDPAYYKWGVPRGACETLSIQLLDEDEEIVDLTGYESDILITWPGGGELEIENDDITISPLQGIITTELSAVMTADLPQGRLAKIKWWITEPGGCRRLVVNGQIKGI